MQIRDLYAALCSLYARPLRVAIEHYLLLRESVEGDVFVGNAASQREALLIRESGEDVELGLYLAPEIVAALARPDPLEHLEAFACAAEGVSHFLYVVDRIDAGRSVSQLELELQGEVDKFLLIHLAAHARCCDVGKEFFERQFERHRFDPRLTASELTRYESASHFAAKFCARLRERCFNPLRPSELAVAARRFFAGSLRDKLALVIP